MSRILSRNTKPELRIRKLLRALGHKFTLHAKGLPGRPDIVLKEHKSVIFIHGCFWHLHARCGEGRIPQSRQEYWKPKLERNKKRDVSNKRNLRKQGWRVLRLWECDIEKKPEKIQLAIGKFLNVNDR